MKVLVLGCDGYIGWPLTNSLLQDGISVTGVDDGSRRRRVRESGGDSLTPILQPSERKTILKTTYGDLFEDWINMSLGIDTYSYIDQVLDSIRPDAIVHLAEQPSAPWSMRSPHHAVVTQMENVIGTLHLLWAMKRCVPEAHLVKLGTMGEYGTPKCIIPEGKVPYECISPNRGFDDCPMGGLMFPRTAGSWYHLSKVHDTHNIEFACRNWGLRSTDIMQGVVYGLEYGTRFDYDQYFGTVINRFCAQALADIPLTVYGAGGQTRGFLPLKDSIQCLKIAINNPPPKGMYVTYNQFESIHTINDLAHMVMECAKLFGKDAFIEHVSNPRVELEEHYYKTENSNLLNLGYVPTTDIRGEISTLMSNLVQYKHLIKKDVIYPTTDWR